MAKSSQITKLADGSSAMDSKLDFLENLIDNIQENLMLIQNERIKLNDTNLSLKEKKKITDENFQKIIELKNNDINAVLTIKNDLMELAKNFHDDEEQFSRYENFGVEDRITKLNKLFDESFSVVDNMKRETELIINEGGGSNGTSSYDEDNTKAGSDLLTSRVAFTGETEEVASNNDYVKDVFGEPLKKALASVILHQPNDPIAYLANYLLQYRKNELSKTYTGTTNNGEISGNVSSLS